MGTPGRIVMALALAIGAAVAHAAPLQAQIQAQIQAEDQDPILEPAMQGTVAYVSGGIGQDELQKIRSVQENYNLRLLFAEQVPGTGIGQYLADIPVKIFDQGGRMILNATARGPFMLISVSPGTYRISAVYNDSAQARTVTVPSRGAASAVFYWPAT